MNSNYKVAIIIVTFNAEFYIRKCLDSVKKSRLPLLTIVVDNDSQDKTVQIIKQEYPDVILIESKENMGFGKGNNLGFKYALQQEVDYVFLLNQDAWIQPNTIKQLIEIHRQNRLFGVLSPLQLAHEKGFCMEQLFSEHLQKFSKSRKIYTKLTNTLFREQLPELLQVPFVNAALWLVSIECLKVVGGFDPLFPHYGEDNDFINRCHFHGYKLGLCPHVISYHERYQEIKRKKQAIDYNRLFVKMLGLMKNINKSFTSVLLYTFAVFLKTSIIQICLFNFSSVKKVLKAGRNILQLIPIIRISRNTNKIKGATLIT